MTAPHAAFRVLAILLAGKAKERNGTMMCTDTYATKFGITSRETVYRSLQLLEERGLIVRTRQGMKLRKVPTLWAVTWWPIKYWDGKPLDYEKPATHAYAKWTYTPIVGVITAGIHTDSRGSVTPIVGVEHTPLHTDLPPKSTSLHTDSREYSKSLAGGTRDASVLRGPNPGSVTSDSARALPKKNGAADSKKDERLSKARKLLAAAPDTDSAKLQSMYQLTDAELRQVRAPA